MEYNGLSCCVNFGAKTEDVMIDMSTQIRLHMQSLWYECLEASDDQPNFAHRWSEGDNHRSEAIRAAKSWTLSNLDIHSPHNPTVGAQEIDTACSTPSACLSKSAENDTKQLLCLHTHTGYMSWSAVLGQKCSLWDPLGFSIPLQSRPLTANVNLG